MSLFSDTPNVTIFAPDNDAFQNLGPAIQNMTSYKLATILDYMLIPKLLYSTRLTNGTEFLTQQGENITILHFGNSIYVNSAQVLTTDVLIANGVVHIIDNVLNPQGPGAQPNPALPTQVPAYASASMVNNLPFTSAIPCSVSCPVSMSSRVSETSSGSSEDATAASSKTSSFSSSSNKAQAAAIARETGFHAVCFIAVLGGALMMV
jgi:transforming growth factor-beta-induced protein